MKCLLLAIFTFACAIVKIQAAVCTDFKCGTITQNTTETDRICVIQKEGSGYTVETCPSGYICNATTWNDVSQAHNETKCIENTTQPIPDNSRWPGDICNETINCIGNAKGVNCTDNICVSPKNGADEACDTEDPCPQGYNCQSKKCVAAPGEGDECDNADNKCKFGYGCVAIPSDSSTFNCTKLFSMEHGANFSAAKMSAMGDMYTGHMNLCKSGHVVEIDAATFQYSCRNGDKSKASNTGDLKTKESGAKCEYTVFDKNDQPDNGTLTSDVSSCGFNKETSAYCPKRKGDHWFTEAYGAVAKTDLTSLNCHVSSTVGVCAAAQSTISHETARAYAKAALEVSDGYGYHLIAANDKCVADAITAAFWEGEDPDFAMNFSLASTLLVVFNIAALLYLF